MSRWYRSLLQRRSFQWLYPMQGSQSTMMRWNSTKIRYTNDSKAPQSHHSRPATLPHPLPPPILPRQIKTITDLLTFFQTSSNKFTAHPALDQQILEILYYTSMKQFQTSLMSFQDLTSLITFLNQQTFIRLERYPKLKYFLSIFFQYLHVTKCFEIATTKENLMMISNLQEFGWQWMTLPSSESEEYNVLQSLLSRIHFSSSPSTSSSLEEQGTARFSMYMDNFFFFKTKQLKWFDFPKNIRLNLLNELISFEKEEIEKFSMEDMKKLILIFQDFKILEKEEESFRSPLQPFYIRLLFQSLNGPPCHTELNGVPSTPKVLFTAILQLKELQQTAKSLTEEQINILYEAMKTNWNQFTATEIAQSIFCLAVMQFRYRELPVRLQTIVMASIINSFPERSDDLMIDFSLLLQGFEKMRKPFLLLENEKMKMNLLPFRLKKLAIIKLQHYYTVSAPNEKFLWKNDQGITLQLFSIFGNVGLVWDRDFSTQTQETLLRALELSLNDFQPSFTQIIHLLKGFGHKKLKLTWQELPPTIQKQILTHITRGFNETGNLSDRITYMEEVLKAFRQSLCLTIYEIPKEVMTLVDSLLLQSCLLQQKQSSENVNFLPKIFLAFEKMNYLWNDLSPELKLVVESALNEYCLQSDSSTPEIIHLLNRIMLLNVKSGSQLKEESTNESIAEQSETTINLTENSEDSLNLTSILNTLSSRGYSWTDFQSPVQSAILQIIQSTVPQSTHQELSKIMHAITIFTYDAFSFAPLSADQLQTLISLHQPLIERYLDLEDLIASNQTVDRNYSYYFEGLKLLPSETLTSLLDAVEVEELPVIKQSAISFPFTEEQLQIIQELSSRFEEEFKEKQQMLRDDSSSMKKNNNNTKKKQKKKPNRSIEIIPSYQGLSNRLFPIPLAIKTDGNLRLLIHFLNYHPSLSTMLTDETRRRIKTAAKDRVDEFHETLYRFYHPTIPMVSFDMRKTVEPEVKQKWVKKLKWKIFQIILPQEKH